MRKWLSGWELSPPQEEGKATIVREPNGAAPVTSTYQHDQQFSFEPTSFGRDT
jgi:hypothetical protein